MDVPEPINKLPISEIEIDQYINAEYIVETIVPYTEKENPHKNTYRLSHIEMGFFLREYEERREYIVSMNMVGA